MVKIETPASTGTYFPSLGGTRGRDRIYIYGLEMAKWVKESAKVWTAACRYLSNSWLTAFHRLVVAVKVQCLLYWRHPNLQLPLFPFGRPQNKVGHWPAYLAAAEASLNAINTELMQSTYVVMLMTASDLCHSWLPCCPVRI